MFIVAGDNSGAVYIYFSFSFVKNNCFYILTFFAFSRSKTLTFFLNLLILIRFDDTKTRTEINPIENTQ